MNRLSLWALVPMLLAGCSPETLPAGDATRQSHAGKTGQNVAPPPEPAAAGERASVSPPDPAADPTKSTTIDDPLFISPAKLTASEQALVDRATRENGLCRGGLGNQESTLDACERRQKLMSQLEKSGLCWGGATIEANMHWIRCRNDPSFTPGQFDKPYYTEEERRDLLGE